MKDRKWFCEDIVTLDSLKGKPIQELIDLLVDQQSDGFTHLGTIFDDEWGGYLCVKRMETDEDYKTRKQQEKIANAKIKEAKKKEELKLLARLKKKYETK